MIHRRQQHDRFAVVQQSVGMDHRGAQLHHDAPQGGLPDLAEQPFDQARFDVAVRLAPHRGVRQQIGAKVVHHGAQPATADVQQVIGPQAFEDLELDPLELAVADQCHGDDASRGLRAVKSVDAHV